MKSDFWRYAVLYQYGGIYADIDVRSEKPVDQWLPPMSWRSMKNKEGSFLPGAKYEHLGDISYGMLSWQDCQVLLAPENRLHFVQWTIASVPGHPLLRSVLTLILEKAKNGIKIENEHFVHYHTGPGVWTEGITRFFKSEIGISEKEGPKTAKQLYDAVYHGDVRYNEIASKYKICIMGDTFYGANGKTAPEATKNLYGSTSWRTQPSWTKEMAALKRAKLDDQEEKNS